VAVSNVTIQGRFFFIFDFEVLAVVNIKTGPPTPFVRVLDYGGNRFFFSQMLVTICQTARRHMQDDRNLSFIRYFVSELVTAFEAILFVE